MNKDLSLSKAGHVCAPCPSSGSPFLPPHCGRAGWDEPRVRGAETAARLEGMSAPVLGGLQGAWPCRRDAGYLGTEQAVSSCLAPAGVWVRGRGRKDKRTIPGAQGINPFPTAHMARPQQPRRDEEPCHAGGGSCSVPSPVSRTRGQDLVCQHSWGILREGLCCHRHVLSHSPASSWYLQGVQLQPTFPPG